MYIIVRCPRCLLTVYTTYVDDGGTKAFTVASLDDEDIPFFNCPMPLCEYHISIIHFINLYRNSTLNHPMSVSHGLSVAPRTADTRPFRTLEQAADLAITIDDAAVEAAGQCEQPPVTALQFDDMAQTIEEQTVQEQTFQGQTVQEPTVQEPSFQETAHEDSQRIPPRKWTDEDVEKLVSMNSQGIQQKKIAAALNRTVVSIQRKLFAISAKLAKEEI